MSLEAWLTSTEKTAIGAIVRLMPSETLGETGGDVFRIPMALLKKHGYAFQGSNIAGDYQNIPELRASFQKIRMDPEDTDASIQSLNRALGYVISELKVKFPGVGKDDEPS